jgi:hypothetical protein
LDADKEVSDSPHPKKNLLPSASALVLRSSHLLIRKHIDILRLIPLLPAASFDRLAVCISLLPRLLLLPAQGFPGRALEAPLGFGEVGVRPVQHGTRVRDADGGDRERHRDRVEDVEVGFVVGYWVVGAGPGGEFYQAEDDTDLQ